MLEHTQKALADEIRAAQTQIEPHRATLEMEYKRACGKAYGANDQDDDVAEDPENQRQAWLRSFLAETAQGTPQCKIEAQGLEWTPGRAALLEMACNQLARELRMRDFAQRTAVDFGFRSARAFIGLSKRGGKVSPFVEDLDFDEFLRDSTATSASKARWSAHRIAPDIDTLIEESKQKGSPWNRAMLERLKMGMQRDPLSSQKSPSFVQRSQLPMWVMWEKGYDIDGHGEDQGEFGTLHYIVDPSVTASLRGSDAAMTDGMMIRESEPWFGRPAGPHCFAAGFKIGTLAIELAPLVANATQGGFANEIARGLKEGIVNYKNLGVVMGHDQKSQIVAAQNGALIEAPHGQQLSNLYAQLQIGGLQPEMLAAFQYVMESLQRASGGLFSNLGDVQSDATATAIRSAEMGYASTMGLYTSNYFDFLSQIFEGFAYWFDLSEDVITRVGPIADDVSKEIGLRGPFVEMRGSFDKKKRADHHRAMGVSIDAFSTRAKNELTMTQDILAVTGAVQFLASLGPGAACVDVDEYMRQVCRSRGIQWGNSLIDSRILYALAAAQVGQQQASKPQGTAKPTQQVQFTGGMGAQPMGTKMGAQPGVQKKKVTA